MKILDFQSVRRGSKHTRNAHPKGERNEKKGRYSTSILTECILGRRTNESLSLRHIDARQKKENCPQHLLTRCIHGGESDGTSTVDISIAISPLSPAADLPMMIGGGSRGKREREGEREGTASDA